MYQKQREIANHLKDKFDKLDLNWIEPEVGDHYLFVPAESVAEILTYLKETWEFCFEHLVSLSGFDAKDHIEVTYHLHSYRHRHSMIIKVKAPRKKGKVPTVSSIYGTANFQEREVYDLLGVSFTGHPNLTRIMLPDDWVGHPLLKDYEEGNEYDGIRTSRESLL